MYFNINLDHFDIDTKRIHIPLNPIDFFDIVDGDTYCKQK